MNVNPDNIWIPLEYKKEEIETFTDRLINWMNNPQNEPEIENWYKYGKPYGIPFYK